VAFAQTVPATPTNAAPAPAQSPADGGVPADVQAAMQLPKGPDQIKALQAALVNWAKTDPIAPLVWMDQLPQDTWNRISQAVSTASAITNSKATADWLVQTGKPSRWGLLHFVLVTWGKADPEAASAWCVTTPQPVRAISYFSVADGWCRKSPPPAAAWVLTIPNVDDRLNALQGVALLWARGDMVALTAWIKTLKPDEMKIAAQVAVDDWRFDHFPTEEIKSQTSAPAWLAQFPFSPADQDAILKAPPLDPRRLPPDPPAAAK
jgi:hypothetical protein